MLFAEQARKDTSGTTTAKHWHIRPTQVCRIVIALSTLRILSSDQHIPACTRAMRPY
jgi:hypothetical protein